MPYKDLRGFLDYLAEIDELIVVKSSVSAKYEVTEICRKLVEAGGPAVLFEKVDRREGRLLVNLFGTRRRCALALGTVPEKLESFCEERASRRLNPVLFSKSEVPCKEVILKGDEVDLLKFPIPTFHIGDGGPYISLGVQMSKDPALGENAAIHRMQVKGRNKANLFISNPRRHIAAHISKARERGDKEIDVAVVVGGDPVFVMAAVSGIPLGDYEMKLAGALRGAPVEVVKCETIDLEVPLNAEIILEGKLRIDELENEGPFCEWTGYQSGTTRSPVYEVTAITHRKNPVFQACHVGKPPNEAINVFAVRDSIVSAQIKQKYPAVKKIVSGSGWQQAVLVSVVQIREEEKSPDNVKKLLQTLGESPVNKVIIAVNEDIDPENIKDVLWAISTRVQPDRDIQIITGKQGYQLDPSFVNGTSSSILIDATKKADFRGITGKIPEDIIKKVEKNWKTYCF